MTHAAKTPRLKDAWKAPSPRDGRASHGAVWAAVLKVSLAAVLAAVLATALTAALGAACSAVLPAPCAHASEASVGIALVPLENSAGVDVPTDDGTASAGAPDDGPMADGGRTAASPRTASLAQTGDLAPHCVLPLALAALAGAIVLVLGRCRPHAANRARRAGRGRHAVRAPQRYGAHARGSQLGVRLGRRRRARHGRAPSRTPGALDAPRSGLALLLAAALAASCLTIVPRALAAESAPSTSVENGVSDFSEGTVAEESGDTDDASVDEGAASTAPSQEAPAAASPANARWSSYWGYTEIRLSGDPIVGTTLSADVTVDPEFPEDIQENLEFAWISWNNDLPWLSETDSVFIPDEALGYRLDLCVTDTTGHIRPTWVYNCGIVGRTLTGSASIEGEMAVLSTVAAVPDLPADAEPEVTWYAGPKPGVHGEKLGTGMTHTLLAKTQGLYISATLEDASDHYYGTIEAFSHTPVRSNAPPPTFESVDIRANGRAWATVALDDASVGQVETIVVERKDGSAWTEIARKKPLSTEHSVGISLDVSDQLADPGNVTVRAYTIGANGTSDPGEEYTIVAQVAVSVPLVMTCEVAGDGTVAATPHEVTNTGDLNVEVVGVKTELDGAFGNAGTWTCLTGNTALYVGPFGSAGELWYPRPISPGESTTLAWKATGLSFEGEELTSAPARYGTISYVIAPDV